MMKEESQCYTDEIDISLLRLLQEDGRLSNAKASEKLSLSEAPCWRRRKRLEAEGIIKDYQVNLDREKLGFEVIAIIHVSFANHADEEAQVQFEASVVKTPEILSCHHVTGESDYILQVVSRDLSCYEVFLRTVIRKLPGVRSVKSSLSLREVKSSTRLPI